MSNVTAKKWKRIGTSIYLEDGGFDVRNCPEPLELAAKIVKCVNYHEVLVEALLQFSNDRTAWDHMPKECERVKDIIAKLDKEPTQ
jgi:hypothetical protein